MTHGGKQGTNECSARPGTLMHAIALALKQLGRVGDKLFWGYALAWTACILCLQNGEVVFHFAEARGSHGMSGRNLPEHRRNEHAIKMHATNRPSPPSLLSQRIGWLALVMDDRFHRRGERTRKYVRKGMEHSSPTALSLFSFFGLSKVYPDAAVIQARGFRWRMPG